MPMQFSDMLLLTRQLASEADTINTFLSDAQLGRHLNENYIRFRDQYSPRWKWETSNTLNGGIVQTNSSFNIAIQTIAEIKALFVEAGGTTTAGTPMTRDDLGRVLTLLNSDTAQGKPRIYALQRVGSFDPGEIGKWQVWFWPIADGTYAISGLVRHEVTELTSPTSKPDLQDSEAYTVCRLAAADIALIAERPPELVQNLLAPVPELMKTHIDRALRQIRGQTLQPSEAA